MSVSQSITLLQLGSKGCTGTHKQMQVCCPTMRKSDQYCLTSHCHCQMSKCHWHCHCQTMKQSYRINIAIRVDRCLKCVLDGHQEGHVYEPESWTPFRGSGGWDRRTTTLCRVEKRHPSMDIQSLPCMG